MPFKGRNFILSHDEFPFISNLKFPSLFCLLKFVYTCTPRPKVVPSIMHLFLRVIWIVHFILYLMWGPNGQNKNHSWQMGKELCCSTRCAPVCARLQQEERLIFMIMNVYQFHLCSCISCWISISVKNAQSVPGCVLPQCSLTLTV